MVSSSSPFTESFTLLLSPIKELVEKLQEMPLYTTVMVSRIASIHDLHLLALKHAQPIAVVASALSVAYVAVVYHLRSRRVRAMERKYAKRIEAAMAKAGDSEDPMHELHLTPREAQEILHVSLKYDHAIVLSVGRGVGLFHTYAIPTMAKLLFATGQFASSSGARRSVDTTIAIDTWFRCPLVGPTGDDLESETDGNDVTNEKESYQAGDPNVDPRNALAIARVNWLHSRYKIRNDDYIFTLSALLFEPIRLANLYGWRKITPLEEEAFFVYWKEIGRRMGIKNIPDSVPELKKWTESYAQEQMVPNESSRKLANIYLDKLLMGFPAIFGIRSLVRSLFQSLFDERIRRTLGFPTPPGYVFFLQKAIGNFISFKNAYLALPSSKVEGMTSETVDEKQLKKPLPRMHANRLRTTKEPWYVAEPTGLAGMIFRVRLYLGLEDPAYAPGKKFKSEGYRLEEIGPIRLENDGHDEVMKIAASIQGCPVVGPWAR